MTNFLLAHWEIVTAVSAYIFLAFVGALPKPGDPRPVAEKVYQAFYDAVHLLANRVPSKYQPQTIQPVTEVK
jgi:hypothetical protein